MFLFMALMTYIEIITELHLNFFLIHILYCFIFEMLGVLLGFLNFTASYALSEMLEKF